MRKEFTPSAGYGLLVSTLIEHRFKKKKNFPKAQRGNNQDKKLPLLVQKKCVRLYFSIPPQLPKIGIAIFLGSSQLTVLSRVSINILNSLR